MELTVPTTLAASAISITSSLPSHASFDSDATSFQVIWQNVSVAINIKGKRRELISRFFGTVKSGEIVAILGPSGSGKTTFLNCLAGSRKPTEGTIQYYAKTKRNAIAYVPQTESLSLYLTVREALLFSSIFKNTMKGVDHKKIVERTVQQLGLENCVNNLISKCSGGEMKRVSVGVEMTSNPSLLLIDELTSGLDSHTAFRCLDVLKNYVLSSAVKPMIILTIHQPNTDLFNLFDKIYLLTSGSCIYEGSPQNMVDYFSNNELFCPMYFNPADFALNIASNHYGNLAVQELKMANQRQNEIPVRPENGLKPMKQKYLKNKTSFIVNYFLLVKSLFISHARDPQQTIFRFGENVLFPFLILFILNTNTSKENGCILQLYNETHVARETVYERYDRETLGATNIFLLYFNSMFIFFSSAFPGVLVFGQSLRVFLRERQNNWYSTRSFFAAFITVNSLFSLFFSLLNTLLFYYLTQQHATVNLGLFLLANVLLTFFGDCFSFLVSLTVPNDPLGGTVCVGCIAFIMLSFSGFIVKMKHYRMIATIISYGSVFKYYFQACVKLFYATPTCVIGDDKILDFDTVLDFIKYYNFKNNDTLDNVDQIPTKVRDSLSETEWTKDKLFRFAEEANDLSEEKLAELQSFWVSKSSYILEEFSIARDGLHIDLIVITSMIVAVYFLCFIFLYFIQKRNRS
ncbi:ATP-binding cassette sub-family G member 1-like protein [Leptotrombidium deliense]|uniref:ATP-binding cassette sub-family G member 1-like protein n=1 Tax=Leptotrombidium deliense TaxID=299467 RepID=A0A443SCT7_9ACAR|nr:ATP-binding cassette sub-family G member 1-like protein [Leptotrombidium deliense]